MVILYGFLTGRGMGNFKIVVNQPMQPFQEPIKDGVSLIQHLIQ